MFQVGKIHCIEHNNIKEQCIQQNNTLHTTTLNTRLEENNIITHCTTMYCMQQNNQITLWKKHNSTITQCIQQNNTLPTTT